MHLALYDISLNGHHGAHIVNIARQAINRNWTVSIMLPDTQKGHRLVNSLKALVSQGRILFTPHYAADLEGRENPVELMRYHLSQYQAARLSLAAYTKSYDYVYVPNLDFMAKGICLLGSPFGGASLGGMMMRVRHHFEASRISSPKSWFRDAVERWSFRRLIRAKGVRCITTTDQSLFEYCRAAVQSNTDFRKVKYVPELGMTLPKVNRTEARSRFGLSATDPVVLVYGALSRRKGLEELLSALDRAKTCGIRVLLVGLPDQEMSRFLATDAATRRIKDGSLIPVLQFADDELETAAFTSADAVWVAYRNHTMMSGVFYQAVSAGLPIITANCGILQSLVERFRVGVAVDLDDPAGIARALQKLIFEPESSGVDRESMSKLARVHSPENFGRAVCNAIAVSAGCGLGELV